eukprot:g29670.t1
MNNHSLDATFDAPSGLECDSLEEFYVSPKSTFMSATEATQPWRSRATTLLQRSVEAAAWVRPGFLDLVFLDGDHRYESVTNDIQAWWPKLRSGGILAGPRWNS